MRILFLNPAGHLGGAERSLLDILSSMRRRFPESQLGLVVGGEGKLMSAAELLGAHVQLLPLGGPLAKIGDSTFRGGAPPWFGGIWRHALAGFSRAAEYVLDLRATIRRFEPDVIHSNGIKMHLLAAAARDRVPLVWHIRDFIGDRPLTGRALGATAWRADAGIAISRAVAEDVGRICPGLPVTVVHNAIDTELFTPTGRISDLDALASRGDRTSRTFKVGLVATYARWKGHDVFLEAARIFLSMATGNAPPVHFYIVGGPIYAAASSQYHEDELRLKAARLGIDRHVTFVPFQNAVDEVYRALDVVVHASSRPEPFGRTIVEAMASAKPVIVSREGGATELFADGVTAIGVPPRDPSALAKAIGDLLADPARGREIGEAARSAAVEHFSRERLADAIVSVYRKALGSRGLKLPAEHDAGLRGERKPSRP